VAFVFLVIMMAVAVVAVGTRCSCWMFFPTAIYGIIPVGNSSQKVTVGAQPHKRLVMNDSSGKDLSPSSTPLPSGSDSASTSASISKSATEPLTSSAFERWRRRAMLVTGLGVSTEERLEDLRLHQVRDCERKKEYLMNYSTSSC